MSGAVQELAVQDAVRDIAGRFPPFFMPQDGVRLADVVAYLEGQGHGRLIANEAAARYLTANIE